MLIYETDYGYKKICIWKDKMPFECTGYGTLNRHTKVGNIDWHIGTICMEVKLHPGHISNYALICMKYTKNQNDAMDIIINFGREKCFFNSNILPFNKDVCVGLNKEFADAIYEFFEEFPIGNLPSGTIEILGGAYDEVGSSNVSFKKVMELLIFMFVHIDKMNDEELQSELFKLI